MEALHGDLGLVAEAGPGHLELAEVPLRLEGEAAVVVGQVERTEAAAPLVGRPVVEGEEGGRGVVGRLVVLGGLHRGPQGQGLLVPGEHAEGARRADVQVTQAGGTFREEEGPGVQVADGLLIRVVVGQPGEVAVEPPDRPVQPPLAGLAPGHQPGLAREAEVQREERPLGHDEVLLEVVEPGVAVRDELPAELDLEGVRGAEVQAAVEQVPGPLEAALERDLVLPEPGQPPFEVEPHPGDIEAALAEGAVVGAEELEVRLVEHVEPEVELVVPRGELEPVGELGLQGELPDGEPPPQLTRPAEMRDAPALLSGLVRASAPGPEPFERILGSAGRARPRGA